MGKRVQTFKNENGTQNLDQRQRNGQQISMRDTIAGCFRTVIPFLRAGPGTEIPVSRNGPGTEIRIIGVPISCILKDILFQTEAY